MFKKLALIALIPAILGLAACVTFTGKGPITFSPKVASHFDKYMKKLNPGEFYVTKDGRCSQFTYCRDVQCQSIRYGSGKASCERRCGRECWLYASYGRIVWETTDESASTIWEQAALIYWKRYDRIIEGTILWPGDSSGKRLEFNLPNGDGQCSGLIAEGRWHAACTNGASIAGALDGGSLIDGVTGTGEDSENMPVQITALPKGIRVTVRERKDYFSSLASYRKPEKAVVVESPTEPLAPGDTFRDCPTCPVMTVVPDGRFLMGSLHGDADEAPPREITIAQPFAVGKFEITFDEWDACHTDAGCTRELSDEGWGRGQHPAINVNWSDAQEYVLWLGIKTGKAYRLLSEAEWEYSARAGTTTLYPWGDEFDPSMTDTYADSTHMVGNFPPNPFGLHDMSGNAWEWVEDCYEPYAAGKTDAFPVTRGDQSKKVLRGGFHHASPRSVRSANRQYRVWRSGFPYKNLEGDAFTGFRVARWLD